VQGNPLVVLPRLAQRCAETAEDERAVSISSMMAWLSNFFSSEVRPSLPLMVAARSASPSSELTWSLMAAMNLVKVLSSGPPSLGEIGAVVAQELSAVRSNNSVTPATMAFG
jgi:hypothetical protein